MSGWDRRSFLATTAGSALASCAKSGGDVLKVGSQRGSTKALILASGVLAGSSLKVEWSEFPAAAHLMEALGAGAVDSGEVGDAPFLFAYASGAAIKAPYAARSQNGGESVAILAPQGSPLKTLADLRGKRIATGRGSIGHYLVLRALESVGLGPKDAEIVLLDPAGAKAAFSTGAVDAWSTWGSYIGIGVLHDGARILKDGRGLLTAVSFQAATDAAIAGKRRQLEEFFRLQAKAQRWQAANQETYAAVLAKETGLPLDVALYTVRRRLMQPVRLDATLVAEEERTFSTFARAGVVSATPDVPAAFDRSFEAAYLG